MPMPNEPENAAAMPGPSESSRWRPVPANASQFHGTHFICGMEGLVLEVSEKDDVATNKFRGDRNQQWLLQPDPRVAGRVALASLEDGRYVGMQGHAWSTFPGLDLMRTPFYWEIVGTEGVYSLRTGRSSTFKFAFPVSPGPCEIKRAISDSPTDPGEEESVKLLILSNTPEVQEALQLGKIGEWAYPDRSVYYTFGMRGAIHICNHLDVPIHAAVSSGGTVMESTARFRVDPHSVQYWLRKSDQTVHLSLSEPIGAQTAHVVQGHIGKFLHVQSLPSLSEWQGIKSVLPPDATYTENEERKAQHIGVKNDLKFTIYVLVLSSAQDPVKQYTMHPGKIDFWYRLNDEVVLVSVGSAPGVPRAFLGKVGYTLEINHL